MISVDLSESNLSISLSIQRWPFIIRLELEWYVCSCDAHLHIVISESNLQITMGKVVKTPVRFYWTEYEYVAELIGGD
jgi:hypothetical protein